VIACRPNIVAIGLQLTTPTRPTQALELGVQLPRCGALDHLRWCIARWATRKQIHVVCLHSQYFYLLVPCRTYHSDQLFQPRSRIPSRNLASATGYPDKVIWQPEISSTRRSLARSDYWQEHPMPSQLIFHLSSLLGVIDAQGRISSQPDMDHRQMSDIPNSGESACACSLLLNSL